MGEVPPPNPLYTFRHSASASRSSGADSAGCPQDRGQLAGVFGGVPPLSRRSALTGQPRSQRIRCLLGSSGTSRRSRRHTAELPRVPPLSRFPRRAFLNTDPGYGRNATCAADADVSAYTSRPRNPACRQPATNRLAAPPAALSPGTPFPASPPVIARIRGEGLEKRAFSLGRFFWGGSGDRILLAAVTLRASAVGAGPVAAAGYARHPEPAGAARRVSHAPPVTGCHACAGLPTCGSTRRQCRLGCHTTRPRAHTRGACCARHTGSGTGLPHGVERMIIHGACGRPCRAVPVACAWWQPPVIRTATVPAVRLPQRHLCRPAHRTPVAGSLRAGCARRRISYPQCGSRRRFASSACHKTTAATHSFSVAAQRGD
jgi:hypothetical protein